MASLVGSLVGQSVEDFIEAKLPGQIMIEKYLGCSNLRLCGHRLALCPAPSLLSRPVKQQDDANANPTPDEVTSLAKAVTRTTEKNKDRLA
jgi:hypothetical protein